ncbi:MAG TPA: hypothetical protein VNT53_05250 [Pseudolysinimonas sp.]|nr:hypothetical protein [Pseudolysinimonas sp.]
MSNFPRLLPTAQLESASHPYVRELGRLVIASSRLEVLTRAIAVRLGAEIEGLTVDAMLDQIGVRLKRRTLGIEASLADDVTAWVSGTRILLEARTRLFAEAAFGHFAGTGADAIQLVTPDGSRVSMDAEYLERMIQRIHRHDVGGHLLYADLEVLAHEGEASEPIALHSDGRHRVAPKAARTSEVV